jgi:hypothetical protein
MPIVVREEKVSQNIFTKTGELDLTFQIGHDDTEYNFRDALVVRFRINKTVTESVGRNNSINEDKYNYGTEADDLSYYPIIKNDNPFTLGWNFTKSIAQRSTFNFNFYYNYEYIEGDDFVSNIFGEFGAWARNAETGASQSDPTASNTDFSFFGIERIFQKLFWTTDLKDPWVDKRNDHLLINASIDTFFNLDYYIGKQKLTLGFKPFIEASFLYRFSQESMYRSRLVLVPGLWLKIGKYIRFLVGFEKTLWAEEYYSIDDASYLALEFHF